MNKNLDELIGVDETGVGDYFSPVISVACYIPKDNIEKLKQIGVKDSKKLSDKRIIEIFNQIENLVYYQKTCLSQSGYNKLIDAGINNNEIKTLIHSNSINILTKKLNQNIDVFIDQYTISLEVLQKHFKKLQAISWLDFKKPQNEIIIETKGEEKSLAVAAASIISRKFLIDWMQRQNKKYNFEFKLGASNKIIDLAANFILKYGQKTLREVAKVSFKTTIKALEKIDNKLE
ncbi:ribonuclease HIII [Metamycoplasma hominis]|uniref:ribonuclease HIII n=2 Tax=Metamycoplasma hominis TaxID=2098 RepID=UPI003CF0D5AD